MIGVVDTRVHLSAAAGAATENVGADAEEGAAVPILARSALRMGTFLDDPVTNAQLLYHLLCSSMGWSLISQLLSAFLHEKQMARSGVLGWGSKNSPAAAIAAGLKFADELKGHL